MSDADGNKIADESTCIKSNITWKKSLAGKCANHNCEEGQKCEFDADGNRYKRVDAQMIYCLNMDDVCSADDEKCKKPNLSGVGMIEKGKCSLTGVLLRYRQLSLLECAKRCFMTSKCTSISYRQNWKLCDLVMSDSDGNKIADDSTCIRSNITTWKQSLAGKCADHNCEEGQKCEFNANNNRFECVEAYCKGLPDTPHAELQEPFGLRRNLDTGNKFKCGNGYKMEGKPFAVCKSPGHWKVLFNCTTKVACSAEGYNYDTESRIKLETPTQKWDEAQQNCRKQDGDLVRITTKKKWDSIILYLEGCGVRNENIWIGLKDNVWTTGGKIITEPSNGITAQLDGQNAQKSCGLINTSQNRLEDANCSDKYKFLCEKFIE